VLRQDDIAHAVHGELSDLYSIVIFTRDQETSLPLIASSNCRVTIMANEKDGKLELAVCAARATA